jgi:hypothetical protein
MKLSEVSVMLPVIRHLEDQFLSQENTRVSDTYAWPTDITLED